MGEGVIGKQEAGVVADPVVVDAEINGVGVGNVDGDERNAGGGDAVGDDRGYLLLDLELDDEIDAGANEFLRVLERGGRVVAVVEYHQVYARGRGGRLQALCDSLGEGHLCALAGEAEAQFQRQADQPIEAVSGAGDVAAVKQSLQDAIDAGLGKSGALKNGFERKWGALGLQELHHIERFGEDRDKVEPLCGLVCQGALLLIVTLEYITLETHTSLMKCPAVGSPGPELPRTLRLQRDYADSWFRTSN